MTQCGEYYIGIVQYNLHCPLLVGESIYAQLHEMIRNMDTYISVSSYRGIPDYALLYWLLKGVYSLNEFHACTVSLLKSGHLTD